MGSTLSTNPSPPFLFALIIGLPSVVLYLVEVIVMLRHPSQFNSAFFRLFLVRFIPNFLNYTCQYVYGRFARVGPFYGYLLHFPRLLLALGAFFYYYCFHAENLATFFMLLNRLTLIVLPVRHKRIWKRILPVSILIVFTVPIGICYPLLGYNYAVDGSYHSDFLKEPGIQYLNSSYIAAWSAVIFCFSCGVVNIVIIAFYHRSTNVVLASGNQYRIVKQKVEARLSVYAFVTFLAQFFMATYTILMYISGNDHSWDLLFYSTVNQLPWVNDFSTIVVPSWMLLWACTAMKERIRQIFDWRKLQFLPTSTAKSTPNNGS